MSNNSPGGNAPEAGTPLAATPLTRAVLELDAYAAQLGWDQPARLFALVDSAEVRRHDPTTAERLGLGGEEQPGALTSIEQEELPRDVALDEFLATIAWPEMITGCAMVVERLMLPPDAEERMPGEASEDELARWVAEHPDRQEIRMTVAVLRDGTRESALRLRGKDTATEVLTGANLVPGLADALAATFEE